MTVLKENKLVKGSDLSIIGAQIKSYVNSKIGMKYGAMYFETETNTLYFFSTPEDRDAWLEDPTQSSLVLDSFILNVNSSIIYRVQLINNNGTTEIQTSTNAPSLYLSLDFDIQMSTIGSDTWTSTGQSARVSIKKLTQAGEVNIPLSNDLIFAGETFLFNIFPYLTAGTSRVQVTFSSDNNSTITNSIVYTITVSEMYIEEFDNNWYNAIVENGLHDSNYKLGGFKIVGSMYKTLHIELYQGNDLVKSFEKILGSSSFSDTPYYYTYNEGFDMQSGGSNLQTGIYTVKAYLTSDILTSLPVIYNIMYVFSYDIDTAQLVCINNVPNIVYNYSPATLCDFAFYNKGASTGSPNVLIKFITGNTPIVKVDQPYNDLATGVLHHLDYNIEWLTEESINLYVYVAITLGNSEAIIPGIPIDNSATYPAETGAIFYLNSITRNNGDTNRDKIINEATNPITELTPTWTKMSWVDGIDGWTVDNTGRKCLLIPANSYMSLPYQILIGENITFEMCFKVLNTADYDENVITIASDPTLAGFTGIRIKPNNVTVHSFNDIDDSNDTKRGTNFSDEEVHHLVITIANSYSGVPGKNLVTGYIDGSVGFQFDYPTGTAWYNNVPFIVGSRYSDVCIYLVRVYEKVLGKQSVEKNFINSLSTLQLREALYNKFYSIVKQSTHEITYENVSKSNKNFFVVEMLNRGTIPSKANNWSKDTVGKSNFEMHFGEHPLWDFKLYNIETTGQGTTSMDYYRWNLRFRIDKSNDSKTINVSYYDPPIISPDGTKIYVEQSPTSQKYVYFDGGANNTIANHPKVKRITGKINFASSMQSHKIGATRAFNDIRNQLGLHNEAQNYARTNELPEPTVAVYEYPAYGFSKTVTQQGVEIYEYIGLFTIGPDKGDKGTFGYDINNEIKSTLITMEGTDHSRRMAKFLYPWNSNVEFRASNECINIVLPNSNFDNAWEVGNCYDLSTDKASDQAAIQSILEREFKPAYDLVYNNSTQIFPIALNTYGATAEATLTAINNDIVNFRKTIYNSRFTYDDMEFWIENEYVLYHYDIVQDKYVAGVNLITDLNQGNPVGSTLDEKNEWFKEKRRERFKESAEDYWDIQDAIYHFLFIVWFGATDNFAKNTYPYKMGNLADGGRWCWRQDDLDTIFDIDNSGGQTKPYYIEYEDASNGSTVFAGSTSIFWNLLYESYWEDYGTSKGIRSRGKDFITAMVTIGTGSNTFEGCRNFILQYFWNNAQEYFNQAAYNVDTVFKYEAAWLSNGQAVDPLTQSLGNHYSAEQLWVDRRIIYMMSLFKSGAFGSYGDPSLGRLEFRPNNLSSITVTPIFEMYPALMSGAGSPEPTERTPANTPHTFVGPFSTEGQTTIYIQSSNYLTSIGDLKNLVLAAQYVNDISINAAKLKEFKIGDDTAGNVTTNVPSISFPNNKCLELINAKNASSLRGPIDLTNCTRLLFADFSGTSITQVNLPTGSKIEELKLSNETTAIILKKLGFLQNLTMPNDLAKIRTLQVESCTYQDAFDMLRTLYDTNSSLLQYIRVIWSGSSAGTLDDISMLANIKNNLNKDDQPVTNNYGGIAPDGSTTTTPVIEGTITLTTGLYTTDLEQLGTVGTPEVIEGTIVRAQTEAFGTLYIIYDSARVYIDFADNAVKNICMRWSTDNIGVTLNDAAGVTSTRAIYDAFRGNTVITKFNEFKYFTSQTSMYCAPGGANAHGPFEGCTALEEITLPDGMLTIGDINMYNDSAAFKGCTSLKKVSGNCRLTEIKSFAFYGCSLLEEIPTLNYLTFLGHHAFYGCSSLDIDLNMPNLTGTIEDLTFSFSGIRRIISLGSITQLVNNFNGANGGTFRECPNLMTVNLPSTLTVIGQRTFYNCTLLSTTLNLPNLVSIGNDAFYGVNITGALNLPSLTSLGTGNFASSTFTSADISSLINIPAEAFRGNAYLTSVTLSNNLTSVGDRAFMECPIAVDLDLTSVTSLGNSAFAGSGITKANLLGSSIIKLQNPQGPNYPYGIFRNCTSLTEVTLPQYDGFIIEPCTFTNCNSLTTVNNIGYCTSIANFVFEGAALSGVISFRGDINLGQSSFKGTNITKLVVQGNITLPSTTVDGGAFCNCYLLTEVDIGGISGSNARYSFYNSGLVTFTIRQVTPPDINTGIFSNCNALQHVYVPAASVNDYKAASGWSAYASIIEAIPTT